uniref:Protein kinase domain-containing protein n=1 Tax=Arundo donax TaxID=35708 RepID=A0A0A9GP42_ARUDO
MHRDLRPENFVLANKDTTSPSRPLIRSLSPSSTKLFILTYYIIDNNLNVPLHGCLSSSFVESFFNSFRDCFIMTML